MGLVGFGGGISVLATLRATLVARRRWLTEREYLTTATVAQMLPGGAAANALAYIGLRFRGPLGALLAYVGFIAPGAVLVTALAALYVAHGVTPSLQPAFEGLNAAVVGVVAAITLEMGRRAVHRAWQAVVALAALALAAGGGAGAGEVAALGIGVGLIVDLGLRRFRRGLRRRAEKPRPPSPPVALPDEAQRVADAPGQAGRAGAQGEGGDGAGPAAPRAGVALAGAVSLGAMGTMALVFFRAGLGAYGGGFAVISTLQAAVLDHGWLTPQQFADAVAIGKLTPGPVLLMATFIGYLLHGLTGALVATLAIFAGPFALVVAVGGWLARVRARPPVRAALSGLTPAVVGLMAAAAVALGRGLSGPADLAIAAAALILVARFRVNPAWLLVAGAAARFGLSRFGV
jgi:chromate transporter